MNLYSPKELKAFLEENGFIFKKNLGQNFLINENTAKKIALSSLPDDTGDEKKLVIEIGPGAGSLTYQLAKIYDKVIALEIDKFAIRLLDTTLAEENNIEIINIDALKFDFSSLKEKYPDHKYYVCSNLPYCITGEMIMKLLESDIKFEALTFLIQKEAAERFASKPGTPEYGAICVSSSLYANSKRLFNVSPSNFIPKPKVDSAVIKFIPKDKNDAFPHDLSIFSKTVRSAFSARRKTLLNTLYFGFADDFDKNEIGDILIDANISPEVRGETLALEDFIKLSNIIKERLTKK